jgi:hypothetical protein
MGLMDTNTKQNLWGLDPPVSPYHIREANSWSGVATIITDSLAHLLFA